MSMALLESASLELCALTYHNQALLIPLPGSKILPCGYIQGIIDYSSVATLQFYKVTET